MIQEDHLTQHSVLKINDFPEVNVKLRSAKFWFVYEHWIENSWSFQRKYIGKVSIGAGVKSELILMKLSMRIKP